MKKPQLLIPLIIILCGCDLQFPGSCAPDSSHYDMRFYIANSDGSDVKPIQTDWIELDWRETYRYTKIYGFDESTNTLYFTEDYISSPEEIVSLNIVTKETEKIILDEQGEYFRLSPNGEYFAFKKPFNLSELWLVSVDGKTKYQVPFPSEIHKINRYKWIKNNEIAFNVKEGSEGVYSFNTSDSTFSELSSISGQYDYYLPDNSIIVSNDSIYFKKSPDFELEYVTEGNNAHLVLNGDKFIYDLNYSPRISDFEGNSKPFDVNTDANSYSQLGNRAFSPDGNIIITAGHEGVFSIDIASQKLNQIIYSQDFEPEEGTPYTLFTSFLEPIIINNGSQIIFLVGREFFDDGC